MKISLPKPKTVPESNDLVIACAFKANADDATPRGKTKAKITSRPVFQACQTIKELDQQIKGYLIDSASDEGFSGDEGQTYITNTLGHTKSKSVALIGLGDSHKQSVDLFRRIAGEAYKMAQRKRCKKVAMVIPERTTVPLFDVVQATAEGIHLASYQFDRYHTKDKTEKHVDNIEIHLPKEATAEQKEALIRGQETAKAVNLARNLINEGPMEMNPQKFAENAVHVAEEAGLKIDIFDEKKLKKENMNLMLAVASAAQSVSPPRLIRLHYKPKKSACKIVLIGKGVTFDTGGLDLKTADGMLDMKTDMSGAAAVLGAMYAIGKLAPRAEVIGYMACVENGVGPHAYHPGDIIVSRKGISVEIGNTDAEGRLVLADAITYALDNDKPDIIVDIATLTGACVVALGLKTAGIFSNDDAICDAIIQSGHAMGESFWRMPLAANLRDVIKSPVADIKNVGDRYGGSITAALFLQEFIGDKTKWAHLDIAGPAVNHKAHSYLPMGGVGFGVRTLVDFVMGVL